MPMIVVFLTLIAAVCAAVGTASQTDAAWIKYHRRDGEPEPEIKGALRWAFRSALKVLAHATRRVLHRPTRIELRDREAGGLTLRLFATMLTLVIAALAGLGR